MEKIAQGQETNAAQGEAECCIGLKTHTQVLFFIHIALAWWCFNWFKAFLVDKLFVLVTFSDSKLVTQVTNSVVFSVRSAVFSK